MNSSTTPKTKNKVSWWVKAIVVAMIGVLAYAVERVIDKNLDNKSTQPSITQNHVDSGNVNNLQNNKDVFINSAGGQQNNNTDSGQQIIINK